ncbi:TetR/AcrR family transcriptional regulator [Nocardioides sp.]|uniref:TetR/AcrR family transcriptional regulator n=1 Tax=Nocardioides sp. TaxID=35761 RepID=UPI002721A25B|nr:TetR/AcrR family transcriptional regulator [Nocardioides sp.]MDO9456464.1 TetR/AcrR family transcriptional regulator [Nocardioides sp.]
MTDDVRRRLLDAAAEVLAEEGPAALTVRRLTREVGASTMAVYTHFGSMAALVREVVGDGFAQLYARVDEVPQTDDTLHDLTAMAAACRQHALAHPQLYAVMFGSASLGGYRLSEEERHVGLAAFGQLVAGVARAMDAGALRRDDPAAVAGQVWTALHGYIMIEQAGFHRVVDDPEAQLLHPMLAHLVAGLVP